MEKALEDKDGDGYPTMIDCEPNNPKKQGALSWIKAKVQRRPYEDVMKETEQKREARSTRRISAIRRKTERETARATYQDVKAGRQQSVNKMQGERLNLQSRRQKLQASRPVQAMPSMFGGGSSAFGSGSKIDNWDPMGLKKTPVVATVKKQTKKRVKRRKQKSKGKRRKKK